MTELHLRSEQEVEAQAVFQRLKAAFEREALVLARVMARKEERELLGRTEFTVRDQVHRLGAQVLEAVLPERKKSYQGARTPCAGCAETARCVAYRGKTIVRVRGAVRLERPYSHCATCGQGFCPWDAVLGVTATALSPGAEEIASGAGVHSSFAEARAKVLPKLAGLRLGESTVERTTEAAGLRLAAGQTSGPRGEPEAEGAWHRDAEGKTVAYVAVDATGVPQQGPEGGKAESRMANVAVIYNPVPEDRARWAHPAAEQEPPWQARSVASLERRAAWGTTVREQGVAVGIKRAERVIALSDGGNGLEACLRTHFPQVDAVIRDFSHAAESLSDGAKAWHGAAAHAGETVGQPWCHQLKPQGGQAGWAMLQGLDLRGRSAAARECYQTTVRDIETHLPRMDYPTYRAKGWQIGSGPVESACKRVVGQRLKGAGMRWGEAGAEAVCRLRALFLSEAGPWDAFGSRN